MKRGYDYNNTFISIYSFVEQQITLSPPQSLKHTPTIHSIDRFECVWIDLNMYGLCVNKRQLQGWHGIYSFSLLDALFLP
jgi:hypothetical protein